MDRGVSCCYSGGIKGDSQLKLSKNIMRREFCKKLSIEDLLSEKKAQRNSDRCGFFPTLMHNSQMNARHTSFFDNLNLLSLLTPPLLQQHTLSFLIIEYQSTNLNKIHSV